MSLYRFVRALWFSLIVALPFVIWRDSVIQKIAELSHRPDVQQFCANVIQ